MEDSKASGCSFELSGRNVHVWSMRTKTQSAVAARFERMLAPDEMGRAARFRFDQLRYSFVLVRGALRTLLGRYLNMPPAAIQFQYGSKGKPSLTAPVSIEFNTSHSGDLAVFAFTHGCEIGIDLEQIRPIQDLWNIANRFFCPSEAAELMSLAADQFEDAFYLCWTRKEAYIKAIGDGLSVPLNSFRVTLQPGQPARLIHLNGDTNAASDWALHNLQLASGYAAALAYRDTERPVTVLPVIDATELAGIS